MGWVWVLTEACVWSGDGVMGLLRVPKRWGRAPVTRQDEGHQTPKLPSDLPEPRYITTSHINTEFWLPKCGISSDPVAPFQLGD